MPQHDFNIANQAFPNFRNDLNEALHALQSSSSGANPPNNPTEGQLWFDTRDNTIKVRNAANSQWIPFLNFDLDDDNAVGPTTNTYRPINEQPIRFLDHTGQPLLTLDQESREIHTGEGVLISEHPPQRDKVSFANGNSDDGAALQQSDIFSSAIDFDDFIINDVYGTTGYRESSRILRLKANNQYEIFMAITLGGTNRVNRIGIRVAGEDEFVETFVVTQGESGNAAVVVYGQFTTPADGRISLIAFTPQHTGINALSNYYATITDIQHPQPTEE